MCPISYVLWLDALLVLGVALFDIQLLVIDDLPDVARAIEGGVVKQLDHLEPICNTKLTKCRLFKWIKHVLTLY